METGAELPTFADLMLPTLRAVDAMDGSATSAQITDWIVESLGFTEEELGLVSEGRERERQIAVDRCGWARSACKLGGALDTPRDGVYVLTDFGRYVLGLPDIQAQERLRLSINRGVHASKGLRLQRSGRVA